MNTDDTRLPVSTSATIRGLLIASLTSLLLLAATPLPAQIRYSYSIAAGGQLNSAFIEHSVFITNLDADYILGPHFGALFGLTEHQEGKDFVSGIRTGIFFSQFGWKQQFLAQKATITRMNYLLFPLDGTVGLEWEKFASLLYLGIYGKYLLFHSLRNPLDDSEIEQEEVKEFYTYNPDRDARFGYGGRLGVGAYIMLPKGGIGLNAFATFSLSNFINYDDLAERLPDSSNLFGFTLTATYMFHLFGNRADTEASPGL